MSFPKWGVQRIPKRGPWKSALAAQTPPSGGLQYMLFRYSEGLPGAIALRCDANGLYIGICEKEAKSMFDFNTGKGLQL